MPRHSDITPLVDNLLCLAAFGGLTTAIIIAPNTLQLLDKPIKQYFAKLDEKERQREFRKVLSYMRSKQLITEEHAHGIRLTPKARLRLERHHFDEITIPSPAQWDKQWRIVFFDIPEAKKGARDGFAAKMRQLGFKVLQRSVFVHPFECRDEVAKVAQYYRVGRYVSYVETSFIDNEPALIKRFTNLLG